MTRGGACCRQRATACWAAAWAASQQRGYGEGPNGVWVGRGVSGEGDVGAETKGVEVVVVGGDADGDGAVRVAWPARDGRGGGSGRGQARADYEVVADAGGGGAGANSRAKWATWCENADVEALREGGLGEGARVNLEIAGDDAGARARAGVGTDGGESREVCFADATAGDEL